MLNDFRFAFRSIRRTPVFTAIVVLTLAVGIAGATAVASVAKAMVFRPLPYPDSHKLVIVGRGTDAVNTSVTFATFSLLRDRRPLISMFAVAMAVVMVIATDTVTYIIAGLLLFYVAAGASFIAAMPVMRIDPAETLRAE